MRNLIKILIKYTPYEIRLIRGFLKPLIFIFRKINKPFFSKYKKQNFILYPHKSLHQTGIALYPRIVEKLMLRTIINEIKKKGIFIDLGSHSGFYAIVIYSESDKIIKSYAFEIDKFSVRNIKQNIKINRLSKNVKVVNKAISGGNFPYSFFTNIKNRGSSFIKINKVNNKSKNKTISLSKWFNKEAKLKISAIKLDIEGQEMNVLTDLFKNINKIYWPDVIVVEINPVFKDSKNIKKILYKNEYKIKNSENHNYAFIQRKNK